MDGICICCDEHTAGGSLIGECGVASSVAGVGVAGATAGCVTAWVAGAGVDVVGATSLMADVSALTASG